MNSNEIYEKVTQCIMDAGSVSRESVSPEKRLIEDLSFDSIDLLDLLYSIETAFGVSIETGEIEQMAQDKLGDAPLAIDSVVTPEGLAVVKLLLPEVPEEYYPENLKVYQIPYLFTVKTLCSIIEKKLHEK